VRTTSVSTRDEAQNGTTDETAIKFTIESSTKRGRDVKQRETDEAC
jgi:hypothetical protein